MQDNALQKIAAFFFDYFGIAVSMFMAYVFCRNWVSPSPSALEDILFLTLLIAMEFFMVHSAVFMTISVWVFFPFYGIFVLALFLSSGDSRIIWLYMAIVLFRSAQGFFNKSRAASEYRVITAFIRAWVYFIPFIIVMIVADKGIIPKLGLSTEFLDSNGYFNLSGGGLFSDAPHIAMCLGTVYYIFLAANDFCMLRNPQKLEKIRSWM
ncbi:hypothetical protein LJC48_06675 [Desulfovibrio sp. OttesenSCG-928-C06]|nr:hypothetical protein [Desulfovibrio sp. OttesenSCG-928-C06]